MVRRLLRFPFCIRNMVKLVKWVRFVGVFFVFSYSRGIDEKLAHVTVCPPLAYSSIDSSICQTCMSPGPPR